MPRNVWAKVWCDFLRHPRFRRRPDCDVRLALGLILYAKEYAPGDGVVRDLDAETMRSMFGISAPLTKVQEGLEYFLRCGWLEHADEQGSLRIKDFTERQGIDTASPTKRKMKVYFIRAHGTGAIKIGCSQNPWARLQSLRTASSEPLQLITAIDGDFTKEQKLQERFKHLRRNREWFNPGQDLLAYIASLPAAGSSGSATSSAEGSSDGSALGSLLQQEEEEEEDPKDGRSSGSGGYGGRTTQAVYNAPANADNRIEEMVQAAERREKNRIGFQFPGSVDNPVESPPDLQNLCESERAHVRELLRAGKAEELCKYLAELQSAQVPETIQRKAGSQ